MAQDINGGKWHPKRPKCSSLSGGLDFYNVPKLSIPQSVEVKVALHYIRKQLACHKGLFLSSHTAHNATLIQSKETWLGSSYCSGCYSGANLLRKSLEIYKYPECYASFGEELLNIGTNKVSRPVVYLILGS